MTSVWFDLWLGAFVSTVLAEAPVYGLFLRDRLGLASALALGVALQCVTHPLFWLAWAAEPDLFFDHYGAAVFGFEAAVYTVEAAIIWAVLPRRPASAKLPNLALAFLASATANTSSVLIGMMSS